MGVRISRKQIAKRNKRALIALCVFLVLLFFVVVFANLTVPQKEAKWGGVAVLFVAISAGIALPWIIVRLVKRSAANVTSSSAEALASRLNAMGLVVTNKWFGFTDPLSPGGYGRGVPRMGLGGTYHERDIYFTLTSSETEFLVLMYFLYPLSLGLVTASENSLAVKPDLLMRALDGLPDGMIGWATRKKKAGKLLQQPAVLESIASLYHQSQTFPGSIILVADQYVRVGPLPLEQSPLPLLQPMLSICEAIDATRRPN
jgi:hypothetical protein